MTSTDSRQAARRIVESDAEALVLALARRLAEIARDSVARRGELHVALSGGSTPWRLYDELVSGDGAAELPWDRTHVWVVDDRCVPATDPRNNSSTMLDRFVTRGPLPAERFHPMPTTDARGAERYEEELRAHLEGPPQDGRLDALLLGMGTDGHTASLFPQSPALNETRRWVVLNDGPRVVEPRPRITMTYPVLNAARNVFVLVTGAGKRVPLARVATESDSAELPIVGVTPRDDAPYDWYLDAEAAG